MFSFLENGKEEKDENKRGIGFLRHNSQLHPLYFVGNQVLAPSISFEMLKDVVPLAAPLPQDIPASTLFSNFQEAVSRPFKKQHLSCSSADFKQLIAEIREYVGWEKVNFESRDVVKISLQDEKMRKVEFELSISRPREINGVTWDPLYSSPPDRDSLKSIVSFYHSRIQELQRFWDELDLVDSTCKVLDPPLPALRSISRRRIALFDLNGKMLKSLFVEVHLACTLPHQPSCEVIGIPENSSWKKALQAYRWNSEWTLCRNLSQAFRELGNISGVEEEEEEKGEDEDSTAIECGMCYLYRLKEEENDRIELPDQACLKCFRPFHHSCVVAWLRSLPTARRSFKLLQGECPYCSQLLTVKE